LTRIKNMNEIGKDTIVLGVIGCDCHSVGNRILDEFFTKAGFNVVNLGVLASQDEFIAAAVESKAQAILVSSLYGHAEIDCVGLREKCVARGIGSIILYIGGNLVVGKTPFGTVEQKFKSLGFDRVFPSTVSLDEVVNMLRADIKERRRKSAVRNRKEI